ncbi:MAG: hypothetical protein EOP13_19390 [Pseudomonas sp.]|nr:MAG: hypothetical protein EOP13_19390 [Pseudomonas sp.]
MEDGYLTVTTRQSGASEKFCMGNRLLLGPLVQRSPCHRGGAVPLSALLGHFLRSRLPTLTS